MGSQAKPSGAIFLLYNKSAAVEQMLGRSLFGHSRKVSLNLSLSKVYFLHIRTHEIYLQMFTFLSPQMQMVIAWQYARFEVLTIA